MTEFKTGYLHHVTRGLSPRCLSWLICQTWVQAVLQRVFGGLKRTLSIKCMLWYSVHDKSLVKSCCYYYWCRCYCCCCYRNSLLGHYAWKWEKTCLEEFDFSHILILSRDWTQADKSWWTILPPENGSERRECLGPRPQTHCLLSATALESSYLQPRAWLPCSHDKDQTEGDENIFRRNWRKTSESDHHPGPLPVHCESNEMPSVSVLWGQEGKIPSNLK